MRLAVSHDLAPGVLARSLFAVVLAEGLDYEVADLLKSRLDGLKLPTERHLLTIVERLGRRYDATVDAIGRNTQRWIEERFGRHPFRIRKAGAAVMLTPEEIEELRALIASHFRPAGVETIGAWWSIPPDVWRRWIEAGIVAPGFEQPEITDAYQAGRLYQVISDGTSYEAMKRLAASLPLTRPQQLSIAWTAQHGAQAIQDFGQKLAGQAASTALSLNQRIARTLITRYLEGDLRVTRPVPGHDLTLEERAALESDRVVDDWRALARELYKQFKGTEAKRDWMRVACSETRMGYNVGRLHAMEEHGVTEVYYLVRDTACAHCKKVYLEADGTTPRVFKVRDLAANIALTGGTNIGRKASKIGDPTEGWIPTGILHPWCRCTPQVVLPGVKPTSLQ